MNYTKQWLSFEDQAHQLMDRGLVADKPKLLWALAQVNYYRLSAYWYPFRKKDPSDPSGELRLDEFEPGTTFEKVWRRYAFDRQLRIIAMDAIERAEVAIRTRAIYYFCEVHGPFCYVDIRNFVTGINATNHTSWLLDMQRRVDGSAEKFVKHYKSKYVAESNLPLWMLAEQMTFGNLLTLYRIMPKSLQINVANDFGLGTEVLDSWLTSLNFVRNVCAHHGRLWSRALPKPPMIPRRHKDSRWHVPVSVPNQRIFGVLTLLRYLMSRIAPQSRWSCRLFRLLEEYSDLPKTVMGFPTDWEQCPIWHDCRVTHALRAGLVP